jgi:hypothetical protein
VFPAKNFGRGLIKEEAIFEFQTAFATEKDQIPEYIRQINDQYSAKYQNKAKKVPILPKTVTYDDVSSGVKNIYDIAIGINKEDLTPAIYDFGRSKVDIITSQDSTKVNSLPPPISSPHGIKIVGLKSPYTSFFLPGQIPNVIPLFLSASIAALVDKDEYSFSAPYTKTFPDFAINFPRFLAKVRASLL